MLRLLSGLRSGEGNFLAAQLVTSATNFTFTLSLSRAVSPGAFGKISLILTGIVFVFAFQRAVIGDPLLVYSGRNVTLAPEAKATMTLLTAAVAVVLLSLRFLAPEHVPWYLVCAGPLLVGQDGLRYMAVASGMPRRVLQSDAIWLVGGIVAILATLAGAGVRTAASAWLAAGSIAVVFLLQYTKFDGHAKPQALAKFFRTTRELSAWLALQFAIGTGLSQGTVVALAATVGIADYGGFRAVQLLVSPILALVSASASPAMAWLARKQGVKSIRYLITISLAFAAAAGVVGLPIAALASQLLRAFSGPQYTPYARLAIPAVIALLWVAAGIPSGSLLRHWTRGRSILRITMLVSVPASIAVLFMGLSRGVTAAAWMLVVDSACVTLCTFSAAARALRGLKNVDTPSSAHTTGGHGSI